MLWIKPHGSLWGPQWPGPRLFLWPVSHGSSSSSSQHTFLWTCFLYAFIRWFVSQGLCPCCSYLQCSLPPGGMHSSHPSQLSDPVLPFFIAAVKWDIRSYLFIMCPFHRHGHSFVPFLVFIQCLHVQLVIRKYVRKEWINFLPNAWSSSQSLQIWPRLGAGKGV